MPEVVDCHECGCQFLVNDAVVHLGTVEVLRKKPQRLVVPVYSLFQYGTTASRACV